MHKFLAVLLALAAAAGAAHAQSAAALLAQSDASRTIPDMSFEVRMTSYDGDRVNDQNTLWGFVKVGSDHNRVLMYFAEPASERGRKLLVDGNTVYLLFPRTSNPIRLSPLQTLIGQASDGDVMRTFANDYKVDSLTDATFDGHPCYRFELTAKPSVSDSSYKTVRLWIDRSSLELRSAEFFAASGALLKRASYRDYRPAEGKEVPFTVDIYAGDDPQMHTVMSFLSVGRVRMPDTIFRRDYLFFWTPERPR